MLWSSQRHGEIRSCRCGGRARVRWSAGRRLIAVGCGGSNGYRVRFWRVQLQKLAAELALTIQVCHLPPRTSTWNKIEHRMFCYITNNWGGRPLVSREVVVNLIDSSTTNFGFNIRSQLDENSYQADIQGSDDELAGLAIERDQFHEEWNYRFFPQAVICCSKCSCYSC
jgi:hypothetical protein